MEKMVSVPTSVAIQDIARRLDYLEKVLAVSVVIDHPEREVLSTPERGEFLEMLQRIRDQKLSVLGMEGRPQVSSVFDGTDHDRR